MTHFYLAYLFMNTKPIWVNGVNGQKCMLTGAGECPEDAINDMINVEEYEELEKTAKENGFTLTALVVDMFTYERVLYKPEGQMNESIQYNSAVPFFSLFPLGRALASPPVIVVEPTSSNGQLVTVHHISGNSYRVTSISSTGKKTAIVTVRKVVGNTYSVKKTTVK